MTRSTQVRSWLFHQLDPGAWVGSGLSPLNRIVVALITLAVLLSILETEPAVLAQAPQLFILADLIFGTVFAIEYLCRMWAVGEDPRFKGFSGRLRYLISPIALIDLLALLPYFLTLGVQDAFLLRLIRLLRLLSLAKFGRYTTALKTLARAIHERRYELLMSLLAAFIVMLFSASVLHFTEGSENPEDFGSIPRALWWGAATVTKVGYGGAFPETVLGKISATIFAIAAVGVVALPTGILAAAFSDVFQRQRKKADD